MSLKLSANRPTGARNRLLNFYIASLLSRPLLTKSCTSATLSFFQEVLASKFAEEKVTIIPTGYNLLDYTQSIGISARAIKLTAYGGLISAPLSHALMKILHRLFPDHESSDKSKIGMILASMLITGPIQNSAYLIAMGAIEGLKSQKEIFFFWKKTIGILTKMSIIVGTLSTILANKFLSKELWVPFFNLVGFVLGTYVNFLNKKKRRGPSNDKKDRLVEPNDNNSQLISDDKCDDYHQRQ
ncbi:hypothetical protein MJO28_004498 [Puccinia striiformis f. sp. tritici]|uniref:Uncharacterized protein n=2 Tax=Puccinia striiformis TaxID=27350 RepID=A0A2S4W460_9BASI|nr:hypothetical protein Pst134EA_006930 [Puccinia striiformis f. sp. tritici]KAH9469642.1 hypothetical protein Pst134EA_006930 [Puccinia striiformis f. sp. tritici]KAI7957403.1 hypothetical protein MJO28_004498 [Puccinia striiformis f. sp. tritici]KAI9616697.1 hypothetical protein KEM48_005114 [Puccinia striiformis f. sp. tritici PST-130]POW16561.1 hypothetical protein PSHT_06644 [Puccinia striiformis]